MIRDQYGMTVIEGRRYRPEDVPEDAETKEPDAESSATPVTKQVDTPDATKTKEPDAKK